MSFATRAARPFAQRLLSPRHSISSSRPRVIPSSYFPRGLSRSFSCSSLWQEKRYTESHEWVEVADDETAKIGISEYAAKSLGDVIFVELPTADSEVRAGEPVGAVESVKSASDVLAPISGKVVEGNTALEDKAKLINESPEDAGWIAKIKVHDVKELEGLMDVKAYKQSVGED
jgi:glycine cleavage system H protein